MPQVYRSLATTTQQPVLEDNSPEDSSSDSQADPDEAVFLSDLVRTGEASRLRRRGAVRLDHAPYHRQSLLPQTPTVIVVDTNTTSVSQGEDEQSQAFAAGSGVEPMDPFARREAQLAAQRRDENSPAVHYTLFCGGYDESAIRPDAGTEARFEPSVLPQMPTPSHGKKRKPNPTNGCGAIIHLHGIPRSTRGVWIASGDATDAVATMDPAFFNRSTVVKIIHSPCGCAREGVGCVVCGNPLGTRFKPCSLVERKILCPNFKHTEPLCPEGPRYWRASAYASHRPKSQPCEYTFFTTAVSSNPSYVFRNTRIRPSSLPSRRSSSQTDVTTVDDSRTPTPDFVDMVFDRAVTDSPTPLSDMGEEDRDSYPVQLFDGTSFSRPDEFVPFRIEFDADGEPITGDEPSSPDKTNELMLFPER